MNKKNIKIVFTLLLIGSLTNKVLLAPPEQAFKATSEIRLEHAKAYQLTQVRTGEKTGMTVVPLHGIKPQAKRKHDNETVTIETLLNKVLFAPPEETFKARKITHGQQATQREISTSETVVRQDIITTKEHEHQKLQHDQLIEEEAMTDIERRVREMRLAYQLTQEQTGQITGMTVVPLRDIKPINKRKRDDDALKTRPTPQPTATPSRKRDRETRDLQNNTNE